MKLFEDEFKRTILFLAISLIALVISFFGSFDLSFDFAWIAIILCGLPIIKEACIGLVTEFDIKADVLVSLALIASVFIGEIFAAGEVAFIMTLGALLEEYTVEKARDGIRKLVDLTPQVARVVIDGKEESIPASDVKQGDILRVIAGETIPVDGIILSGESSIDQSVMTGESIPIDKTAGDEVYSGTVNQFGVFEMKATKVGEDSSLQRMISLVESADAKKAKIVGIADRWATWIVVIALSVAVLTYFVTGEIIRSVTVLVVFCPCALVLATPTAIMAGIGNATKHGVLISQGDMLERLSKVKYITLDKTGTLTFGKPEVIEVTSLDKTISDEQLLWISACVESHSEHPLGKSIVNYYKEKQQKEISYPQDFQLMIGKGVKGTLDNVTYYIGNLSMLQDMNVTYDATLEAKINVCNEHGNILLFVVSNQKVQGYIVMSDIIREESVDVINELEKEGYQTILLTGDNKNTAQHIASQLGINTLHSQCLPEDKLRIIQEMEEADKQVCMVGDGINDAPALKAASVGISMGGIGSDIAIDASDATLLRDNINILPYLLKLSKKTMNVININLTLSMLLNFIAIILATTGILNPIVGALVHNVGSVAVIIHSSLLLKWGKRNEL